MAISDKLTELIDTKEKIKVAIESKGQDLTDVEFRDYDTKILEISGGGGGLPSLGGGFLGASIPLTYKNYDRNEFVYTGRDVTITGLDGVATVTGNGSSEVTVVFDVDGDVSELIPFVITSGGFEYKGLWAHYGDDIGPTDMLAFAYTNISPDGVGEIDSEYRFIRTTSDISFTSETAVWNGIRSYQLLNFLTERSSLSFNFDWTYSFNQPITIPSTVTSIRDDFLRDQSSFNQPIIIEEGVTSIGAHFLSGTSSFNQPITIPSSVTSIGAYFLRNAESFNQPIIIEEGLTSIGTYFLVGASSFNQPLTIPSTVTSIGLGFLNSVSSFNQPITIPSSVTSIGGFFLRGASSFNQPLTIPSSVTSIGDYFLRDATSFNQPITIPSSVTSIGAYFLRGAFSLSTIIWNSPTYPTGIDPLSQTVNSKPVTHGIKVYGLNRAGLISALPNRTSTPFRRLVNGGR